MGFPEDYAKLALKATPSLEEAIQMIITMQEDPNFDIEEMKDENFSINYKMVIVARKDLKMQPGKVAAQVGHGVLAAYKACLEKYPKVVQSWEMFG